MFNHNILQTICEKVQYPKQIYIVNFGCINYNRDYFYDKDVALDYIKQYLINNIYYLGYIIHHYTSKELYINQIHGILEDIHEEREVMGRIFDEVLADILRDDGEVITSQATKIVIEKVNIV